MKTAAVQQGLPTLVGGDEPDQIVKTPRSREIFKLQIFKRSKTATGPNYVPHRKFYYQMRT